jgi:hypothetical protein
MSKDSGVDNSGQNEAAKQMAQIAGEMWENYKSTYLPMEKSYVADAQNYDSEGRREQFAGRANADVQQAFDNQLGQQERELQRYGVAPDSGKFASVNSRLRMGAAAQSAGAMNAARQGVEDRGWARRTDALSLGKGLPAQASQGFNAAGNQFGQVASNQMAQNKADNDSMGQAVSGSLVAAGPYGADVLPHFRDGGIVRHYAGGGYASPNSAMSMMKSTSPAPSRKGAGISPQTAMQLGRMGKGIYTQVNNKLINPPSMGPSGAGETMDVGGMDAAQGASEVASGVPAQTAPMDMLAAPVGTDVAAGGAAGIGDAAATAGAAAAAAAPEAAAAAAGTAAASAAELAPLLLLLAEGGPADETHGGGIQGPGTETSDSIPAMLSDGEYVLNAEAVKHFGLDKLNKMNETGLKQRYGIRK